VTDADGRPLPGANVTLIDMNFKSMGIKVTDENGNFDFVNMNSTTNTVSVRVSYFDGTKVYENPSYFYLWYPAKGMQYVNHNETRLESYRLPSTAVTLAPTIHPPPPLNIQPTSQPAVEYNVPALALACILGIVSIFGIYFLFKKFL
jgi:Carboxypeptidase regulatory-like domain